MNQPGFVVRRRRELTLDDYYQGVTQRNIAVLARALTLIESSHAGHQRQAEELMTRLLPYTGQAIRVGITGVPGVGKSTFIESLGLQLVGGQHRVAVLAVDPSSGISGGSILGDKTRMPELSAHESAYVRPSPSAGTLGGVARRTRESMLVCEAAGFDVLLIETVGVGQSETLVASMTDCFVGLMLPGAGDELQGIKRGLLELVDLIVVNKADGPMRTAAKLAASQYTAALHSLVGHGQTSPTVLTCSALAGENVDQVWDTIARHHAQLLQTGELTQRRRQQDLRWLWATVDDRLGTALREHPGVRAIVNPLERDVLAGTLAPEAAARRLLDAFGIP